MVARGASTISGLVCIYSGRCFVHFILLNNLNGIGGTLRDSEERPIQMTFSFYLVFLGEHGPIRS